MVQCKGGLARNQGFCNFGENLEKPPPQPTQKASIYFLCNNNITYLNTTQRNFMRALHCSISSYHVDRNHGVYVIATQVEWSGKRRLSEVLATRRFRDFFELQQVLGLELGLHLTVSRIAHSSSEAVMHKRARELAVYLKIAIAQCRMKDIPIPSELLKFLNVSPSEFVHFETKIETNVFCSSPPRGLFVWLILLIVRFLRFPFRLIDRTLSAIEDGFCPPPLPTALPNTTTPKTKTQTKITELTPAASQLYDFISPSITQAGRIPLFVIPPGAVKSFVKADNNVVTIELYSAYERRLEDQAKEESLGIVTFEIEFAKLIRGTLTDEGLVNIEGVKARRLPLKSWAKVHKMVLPMKGDKTIVFSAKLAFIR